MRNFLLALTVILIFGSNAFAQAPVVEIQGTLTGNHTWTSNNIYLLKGYVRVDSLAVLTIEPGTIIKGQRSTKGTLIVQRGGKIYAEGTAERPIVMTSERNPGLRQPGDWGGLVICGSAPNNVPGGTAELEGGYGAFHGGNNPDDNSGVVRYVRIEYAGVPINPNEEVNSLTLGSVGRGTVIEYVQTSYGLDDAFEWFGGTVNGKYLVAYHCLDDDFDVDLGFSGKIQYAIGIRGETLADQSGSNGFEVDNNGSGSLLAPFTSAVFSNVSIIGPKANRESAINTNFQHAAQLRRSNKLKIYNSFMTGYPYGIYIDGANTIQHALADELQIRNTVLAGVEHWGGNGFGSAGTTFTGAPSNGAQHPNAPRGIPFRTTDDAAINVENWFLTSGWGNQFLPKWQDAGIDPDIFDLRADATPGLLPLAGSILLQDASFTNTNLQDPFFEQVNFRGAFGTTDWTLGWTNWTPQTEIYTNINELEVYGIKVANAFPNPFSTTTTIAFELAQNAHVSIDIFDISGKKITSLVNETLFAGMNEVKLDAGDMNVGIYFARITTNGTAKTVRLVVAR